MKARGLSIAVMLAAAGVVAGSLVLASVFSPLDASKQTGQSLLHDAQFPLAVKEVFKYRERGGDAIGGSSYFRMEEEFVDSENHCDFCTALEYTPGPSGRAAVAFWNSEPVDLGGAGKLVFAARGEKGGERLVTHAAGNGGGSLAEESAGSSLQSSLDMRFSASKDLTLTEQWQTYEMDLQNADLSRVTHAFAFEILKGNEDEKQVAYIDSIYFVKNDPGFEQRQ
ncbi:MAG TPA: hypothetical protein VIB07_03370 [Nitrososphaera sp.]